MTILVCLSKFGLWKNTKELKIERETKCYWFSFPYKIHKKTLKDVHDGLRVLEVKVKVKVKGKGKGNK